MANGKSTIDDNVETASQMTTQLSPECNQGSTNIEPSSSAANAANSCESVSSSKKCESAAARNQMFSPDPFGEFAEIGSTNEVNTQLGIIRYLLGKMDEQQM